jgi:hypothetical protein
MWRLALGVVLAIVILWMLLKRKSSYKPPEYKPEMTVDELSAEFNKSAGDMTAEMEVLKMIPGNESKVAEFDQKAKEEYDKLNKEFELWKAKTVEAAPPMNEQPPAPAPAEVPSPVVNVLPVPTTSETQTVSPPAEISPA